MTTLVSELSFKVVFTQMRNRIDDSIWKHRFVESRNTLWIRIGSIDNKYVKTIKRVIASKHAIFKYFEETVTNRNNSQ